MAKKRESRVRVALVTGASRGLGKAISERLKHENIVVISASRKAKKKRLNEFEYSHPLDVSDTKNIERIFKWIDVEFGALDFLVNNAGVGVFKPMIEMTLDDYRSVMATNVEGSYFCAQHAVKRMLKTNGGRIVNIGSIANEIALPGNTLYGMSKWALKGLSAIANEELKSKNIRFTHVSLGATYTDIWKGRKGFSASDMLTPEIVAEQVVRILTQPLTMRIDEIKLYPSKGIL